MLSNMKNYLLILALSLISALCIAMEPEISPEITNAIAQAESFYDAVGAINELTKNMRLQGQLQDPGITRYLINSLIKKFPKGSFKNSLVVALALETPGAKKWVEDHIEEAKALALLLIVKGTDTDEELAVARDLLGYPAIVNFLVHFKDSKGASPLMHAISKDEIDIAEVLIRAGADPNQTLNGVPALLSAADHDKEEIVKKLLEAKADPNAQDIKGLTALMIAANNGNQDIVEELLEAGADPNLTLKDSKLSALMTAAKKGYLEIVQLLLAAGADPTAKSKDGKTAVQFAAEVNQKEVIKLILSYLQFMNAFEGMDLEGAIALVHEKAHDAVLKPLFENSLFMKRLVNDLIKRFYPQSTSEDRITVALRLDTPGSIHLIKDDAIHGVPLLIYHSIYRHPELVKKLIDAGADVNAHDLEGQTAIMYAIATKDPELITLLINADADLFAHKHGGKSVLSFATDTGDPALVMMIVKAQLIQLIKSYKSISDEAIAHIQKYIEDVPSIKRFLTVEYKSNYGESALELAAQNGHEKLVKILLAAGADPNAKDHFGQTALMETAYRNVAIVKELLQAGADPNLQDDRGKTALRNAAIHKKNKEIVQALLAAKADPNISDETGNTPLLEAASTADKDIVKLLLDAGANVNVQNKYGWTALINAATFGNKAVVPLLLEKGININATDNKGRTALAIAQEKGYEDIAKMIEEYSKNKGK